MEIIKRNSDYAFRAIVHLALNSGKVVSVLDIASSAEVPVSFLQKIMQQFVHVGLVISKRGTGGGFTLAKQPAQITVLEVVETIQGKLTMNRCLLGKTSCPRSPNCKLKGQWLDMEDKFREFMASLTLEDLLYELQKNE